MGRVSSRVEGQRRDVGAAAVDYWRSDIGEECSEGGCVPQMEAARFNMPCCQAQCV